VLQRPFFSIKLTLVPLYASQLDSIFISHPALNIYLWIHDRQPAMYTTYAGELSKPKLADYFRATLRDIKDIYHRHWPKMKDYRGLGETVSTGTLFDIEVMFGPPVPEDGRYPGELCGNISYIATDVDDLTRTQGEARLVVDAHCLNTRTGKGHSLL
jgi:hypothetical protein